MRPATEFIDSKLVLIVLNDWTSTQRERKKKRTKAPLSAGVAGGAIRGSMASGIN